MASTLDIDVGQHVADLNERGFTILDRVVSPKTCDAIVEAVVRLEDELRVGPGHERVGDEVRLNFEGLKSHRVRNILKYDEVFQEAAQQPEVLALMEEMLGAQFLIQAMLSIAVGPGEIGQTLHADDLYYPLARPHPAYSCNCLWALTDFTAENGATRIVPGSHLYTDTLSGSIAEMQDRDENLGLETVPAEMPQGSILVIHGSVFHAAGANTTDERRFGLSVSYCAGWIRPQENLHLGIPFEKLQTFAPRLQELIGVRGKYKGHIGNIAYDDPADVLFGE